MQEEVSVASWTTEIILNVYSTDWPQCSHLCGYLLCFELVLVEFWWNSLKSMYESARAWLNQSETWLGEWSLWKSLSVPFEWFGSLSRVPLCFWSYSTNSPFSHCPLGVSLCPQSPLWHGPSTPSSLLRTREHCQALRPELSQRPPMPCLHGRWLGTEECLPLDGFRRFSGSVTLQLLLDMFLMSLGHLQQEA